MCSCRVGRSDDVGSDGHTGGPCLTQASADHDLEPVLCSWADEEWEALVAEAREEGKRSHWGRFMRLFGDEADPRPDSAVSDDELLARLAEAEALTTQLMALQSHDLHRLRKRRLADQSALRPPGHDPESCTRGCCDDDGWVTLEVATTLALSERQVERRIDTAVRLERFRTVKAAVRDGLLQSWTATKLLEHLETLAPHVSQERLDTIEHVTLAWLTDRPRTIGQLNARMRRLLLQVRAHEEPDDVEKSARDRRVRVTPADGTGLATLVARLPDTDAVAIAGTLRALGHDPTDPSDGRTREQRECDLFTSSVTGLRAQHGHAGDLELVAREAGSIGVRLDVTVPATSLRGGDAPADIPGYGVVPAATAATLTEMAGGDVRARPLVHDPATGRLLGAGQRHEGAGRDAHMTWLTDVLPSGAYAHPPVMERMLRLRDAVCRAPGCTRRADACDCDHVVPYPDGATALENSCCLCRRHHRLKTHAPGWSLHLAAGGTASWTTPTGTRLTTDPAAYDEPAAPSVAETPDPEDDVPPF
jgi:hypothetical protein